MVITSSKEKLVVSMVRWALVLFIIGLVQGVYSREILRAVEGAGLNWPELEALRTRIFLGHGHTIFIGFLIPAVLAGITKVLGEGLTEKRVRSLSRAFLLVMIGTVITLALTVYTSSAIIFSTAGGTDPHAADRALFGGSPVLRAVLYTIAHPSMGVGLIWYTLVLLKGLREKQV